MSGRAATIRRRKAVTNLQLLLSIGIPTLAIIISYVDVRGRLSRIEADLR